MKLRYFVLPAAILLFAAMICVSIALYHSLYIINSENLGVDNPHHRPFHFYGELSLLFSGGACFLNLCHLLLNKKKATGKNPQKRH